MGEYWKYERRLYAHAWAQVWPKSALSVAANISGPFLIGAISTGVFTVGFDAGLSPVVAAVRDQILAALAGGAAGTLGWGILRFWYGLVMAPFRLHQASDAALAQTQGQLDTINARSPLQIIFDPANDDSFVVDEDEGRGGRSRAFWVHLRNNSSKSIRNIELRALPTQLAEATIYAEFPRAMRLQDDRIVIALIDVLHPGEEVSAYMFRISESARGYEEFNGDQIDLEATGVDVKMDHLTLEYSGGDDPALRSLTPV